MIGSQFSSHQTRRPEFHKLWAELVQYPFANVSKLCLAHGVNPKAFDHWMKYWHEGELAQLQRRAVLALEAEYHKLQHERPKWVALIAVLMEKLGTTELPVAEAELRFRANARAIWEDGVLRTFGHERALLEHFSMASGDSHCRDSRRQSPQRSHAELK